MRDTNTDSNGNSYVYTDSYADCHTYADGHTDAVHGKVYTDAEAVTDSAASHAARSDSCHAHSPILVPLPTPSGHASRSYGCSS